MNRFLLDRSWRVDVARPAWLRGEWQFARALDGTPVTNVPRKVVHHSPAGFEWGYGGSGPADLALNIAHAYFKLTNVDDVKCYQGKVAAVTWACHQKLKSHFIAPMDRDGALIKKEAVLDWLMDWLRGQQLLFPE